MSASAPLRVLFLGTPEFAVPALEAIAASRHPVVGVISQPDRPQGRGRHSAPTPVRAAADARGLALLQPERIAEAAALEWMRGTAPDVGVVVAFGQFLPRGVRELARLGMINAHASLLPRHRGAAPIAHAILHGDRDTGISIMRVAREMDAGDVCAVRSTPIEAQETAGELTARLAPLAAEALLDALEQLAAGSAKFAPQDAARVTLAPKLTKEWARLDWSAPRAALLRQIRAALPWPGCDIELARSRRRLRLLRAHEGPPFGAGPAPAPGSLKLEDGALRLAAVDGWLDVVSLQEAGGRPLDTQAYARGARLPPDEEVLVR